MTVSSVSNYNNRRWLCQHLGRVHQQGREGTRLAFSAQDWAAVGIPGMQEHTPRRGEGNGTEHGTDNSSPQVAIASVRSLQELFRPRGIQIKVFWSPSSSSLSALGSRWSFENSGNGLYVPVGFFLLFCACQENVNFLFYLLRFFFSFSLRQEGSSFFSNSLPNSSRDKEVSGQSWGGMTWPPGGRGSLSVIVKGPCQWRPGPRWGACSGWELIQTEFLSSRPPPTPHGKSYNGRKLLNA